MKNQVQMFLHHWRRLQKFHKAFLIETSYFINSADNCLVSKEVFVTFLEYYRGVNNSLGPKEISGIGTGNEKFNLLLPCATLTYTLENIRKPLGFLMFPGGIDKQHQATMG